MRAVEQDEVAIAQVRQDWRAELEAIAPERFVFLDESAILTNMVRTHARSLQGTRAYGTIPCSHWRRLTVLGALGKEGILAAMSIEAARMCSAPFSPKCSCPRCASISLMPCW